MSIPVTNEISTFMHCGLCLEQKKPQNIEVGYTRIGLQVWCRNHNCNIIHIDFERKKHPANTRRMAVAPAGTSQPQHPIDKEVFDYLEEAASVRPAKKG